MDRPPNIRESAHWDLPSAINGEEQEHWRVPAELLGQTDTQALGAQWENDAKRIGAGNVAKLAGLVLIGGALALPAFVIYQAAKNIPKEMSFVDWESFEKAYKFVNKGSKKS